MCEFLLTRQHVASSPHGDWSPPEATGFRNSAERLVEIGRYWEQTARTGGPVIRHLVVAVIVLIASLAGPLDPAQLTTAQLDAPVDLVSTLLVPADLEAVGLDGYGTGVGATGGADTMVAFDRAYRGASADDARFPSASGSARGASLYLVDRSATDEPDRVLSSVTLFGNPGDASDVFDAVVSARADIAETTDDDPKIETESALDSAATFLIAGVPPYDADGFRQTSIVARIGSDVIEVAIERFDANAAPVQDVADLLPMVLDRLGTSDAGGPSLGAETFEVTGDQIVPALSRYVFRDGEPISQFGQQADAADAQATTFATYEATEVFQLGFTSPDGGLAIGGFLSRHDSEDVARSYFRAIPDLLATNELYTDVRVGNVIVRVGDSATLLTYSIDAMDGVVVTELVVLLGDTVAELIVNAPSAIPSDDMSALATAAQSCLTDGDCQPLVVPDDAGFGIV